MIKNIIFDLGNVILKDNPSIVLENLKELDKKSCLIIKRKFFNNWNELDLGNETYVRLVFSNFLILPLIKVGVTLENSHINSILCFRHSSNCNSCLIIFIFLHHPFVWTILMFLGNKKINQILFSD